MEDLTGENIDVLNTNEINGDINSQNKFYEVICWATDAFPKSETLWHARLHFLLSTNKEELAVETLNKATSVLKENSLRLWQLRLLHIQTTNPENLEKFFQDALKSEAAISNYMKPIYIQWTVLTKDIIEGRKVYDELCRQSLSCLEFHRKMATFELIQPEISLSNARKPHEMTTSQFGKENINVWMEFITFEMSYGEPTSVPDIYNRAVKTLKSALVDKFIDEFSSIKANLETLGISL